MKVFLFNQKLLSVINRKEEITDETCLITDQEEDLIIETLNSNGYFWRIDRYTVGASGKKPDDTYKWDNETYQWVIDNDLLEQQRLLEVQKRLEQLNIEREEENYTGVIVNGKHYPTDTLARTIYNECTNLLVLGIYANNTNIETKEGQVILTGDLLKQINIAIYNKGVKLNEIMQMATEQIKKSKNPTDFKVKWQY